MNGVHFYKMSLFRSQEMVSPRSLGLYVAMSDVSMCDGLGLMRPEFPMNFMIL